MSAPRLTIPVRSAAEVARLGNRWTPHELEAIAAEIHAGRVQRIARGRCGECWGQRHAWLVEAGKRGTARSSMIRAAG